MNDKEINQVDVSIVIVNYKAVSLILNCLDSIQQLTQEVSYEIIVVDNNSNDDFELRIQERYPKVSVSLYLKILVLEELIMKV